MLKGLAKEQVERVKNCKSEEELLELARKEEVKLTSKQLASISGGCGTKKKEKCPFCGSENVKRQYSSARQVEYGGMPYHCNDCGEDWTV